MSLFKYIERTKAIHQLIEAEKTGSSHEFANRIGISRSLLMEHLREMREDLNAPIGYCRKRETFYYNRSFKFSVVISAEMGALKGGYNFLKDLLESSSAGLYSYRFAVQDFEY
ncbi:MAG: hypothetical protein WAZ98_14950 [Cyclobacteriaceae bacterium]